jgi:hypothetical protein
VLSDNSDGRSHPRRPPVRSVGGASFLCQAVGVINAARNELATYAQVTDAESCKAEKRKVADVISQYYNQQIGFVADELFSCACENADFASGGPPPAPPPIPPLPPTTVAGPYPCHGLYSDEYAPGSRMCFPTANVWHFCSGAPGNFSNDPDHSYWTILDELCR